MNDKIDRKKTMTTQIPNGYDDDDLKKIVTEIESYEDDKVSARAVASGKCGALAKKIKTSKKVAKSLNIPTAALNGLLKTRKLERQLKDTADAVPDEFSEIFVDMTKLLGVFADTALGSAAVQAAKQRHEASEEVQRQEQEDGAKVLDELSGN